MLFEPLCTNLYGEVSRVISKGSTGNGGTDYWNSGSGLVNTMYTGSRIYQGINYIEVYSIYSVVGGFCYESKPNYKIKVHIQAGHLVRQV